MGRHEVTFAVEAGRNENAAVAMNHIIRGEARATQQASHVVFMAWQGKFPLFWRADQNTFAYSSRWVRIWGIVLCLSRSLDWAYVQGGPYYMQIRQGEGRAEPKERDK